MTANGRLLSGFDNHYTETELMANTLSVVLAVIACVAALVFFIDALNKNMDVPLIGLAVVAGLFALLTFVLRNVFESWHFDLITMLVSAAIMLELLFSKIHADLEFLFVLVIAFVAYFYTPGRAVTQIVVVIAMMGVDGVIGALNTVELIILYGTSISLYILIFSLRLEHLPLQMYDHLTHTLNRAYLYKELHNQMKRARRGGMPLSIILLDIDNFKLYNDKFGHVKGDRLLSSTAKNWLKIISSTKGVLGRYGGDEFIAMLPGFDENRASEIAKILLSRMQDGISASCGIAQWDGQEATDKLIARADAALAIGKLQGKKTFVSWQALNFATHPPAVF